LVLPKTALTTKFEAGLADLSTEVSDLSTQLTDVEADILAKMQENEDAGMDRDTALATAIDDVSTELGLAKEDLLTAIGTTEDSFDYQI
jgi:capsid protein